MIVYYVKWKQLIAVSLIIDDAFEDSSGNAYLCQRKYYAEYQSYSKFSDTNTAYSGDPSFTKDFTGVAYVSGREIYVFQSKKYTKLIFFLLNMVDIYIHQHMIKVVDEIKICSKVTAAYAYNNTGGDGYKVTIERNTQLLCLAIVCVFCGYVAILFHDCLVCDVLFAVWSFLCKDKMFFHQTTHQHLLLLSYISQRRKS